MSRYMRVSPSATAVLIMLVVMSAQLQAAQIQFTWTAPTTNADGITLTDLAGYRLYYGQTSGTLAQNVDVGNQTTYLLSGLVGGQVYYFAVTAYNTSSNQGALSNETSATTSTDPPPPPVASFTGSPTAGSAPLTVTFTDTSTGQLTTWAWTFGNNNGSSAQYPQHTYANAGTYTVTLTVNGPGGSNTATKQGYISVAVPLPPSSGLVAPYSFDEGTGSTVTYASGNGYHGTISGATWTSGRFGKVLNFHGVNDRVTIPDAPIFDLTAGMALGAWVHPTALSSGRTVLMLQTTDGRSYTYSLYANEDINRPSSYVVIGDYQSVVGTQQLPLNQWSHLVATHDKATLWLYVNGLQVAQRLQTGLIPTSDGPLRIGGNSLWGEYFKGRIDEMRIYNCALTSSQIQTDMNTPVSTAGGATLARHTPLTIRVHEALRGNASASREKAIGLSQIYSAVRQSLRLRDASVSLEAPPHLIEASEVQVTPLWQRVEFSDVFVDPVVMANAVGTSGGARHSSVFGMWSR
jgi:PKD repeat protein